MDSRNTPDEARRIIDSLLNSPEAYRGAAERENEVWGKVLSDADRQELLDQDRKAAATLGVNRHHLTLLAATRPLGLQFERGLSLACGAGRAERELIKQGVCKAFHGIDIAAQALDKARAEAARLRLDISYQQADLNEVQLEPSSYNLIVTQNCLHHVLRLEHLADQMHRCLKPGGLLWVHDYIGETQFQYSDDRLNVVNALLAVLPETYRRNLLNGQVVEQIVRRSPGTLASPFEAIRSGEIVPVLLERFEVVEKYEFNSILHLVCQVGMRSGYAASPEGRALYEMLFLLDEMLVDHGIIPPAGGQYLLRRREHV